MKQILFPAILAILFFGISILSGVKVTKRCDELIAQASHVSEAEEFRKNWESFSKTASFISPYDLIRTGDANCQHYVALIESDADDADIEAAREVLISSIQQIRRIHSLDWELIF